MAIVFPVLLMTVVTVGMMGVAVTEGTELFKKISEEEGKEEGK